MKRITINRKEIIWALEGSVYAHSCLREEFVDAENLQLKTWVA